MIKNEISSEQTTQYHIFKEISYLFLNKKQFFYHIISFSIICLLFKGTLNLFLPHNCCSPSNKFCSRILVSSLPCVPRYDTFFLQFFSSITHRYVFKLSLIFGSSLFLNTIIKKETLKRKLKSVDN